MVWGYPKSAFAADLQAGVRFVMELEREKRGKVAAEEGGNVKEVEGEKDLVENLVLVGHSAGGGLTQFALSKGLVRVGGYVCMAGFPGFGG